MRITAPPWVLVVAIGCGPTAPGGDAASDADAETGDEDTSGASMTGPGDASTISASASATATDDDDDDGADSAPMTTADDDADGSTDDGAPAECLGDVNEPNDTPDTATALDFNPVPSVLCEGDVDEWFLELDRPGYMEPSISADPFGAGFEILVRGPDGEIVLEAVLQNETGTQQDIHVDAPTAGRYTVRVEHFAASAGPTEYAIIVDHGFE